MFHKTITTPTRSSSSPLDQPEENKDSARPLSRLLVLPKPAATGVTEKRSPALIDLLSVSANRCSTFLAEAAVLVLVLALLDRFMLKGTMEMSWIVSAFGISIALLAASIATDFSARRWLSHH
jgi:hypothetical protein